MTSGQSKKSSKDSNSHKVREEEDKKKNQRGGTSGETEQSSDLATTIEKTLSVLPEWILYAYLVMMLCFLPLYMTNGYGTLGSDKANYFERWTKAGALLYAWCWLIYLITLLVLKRFRVKLQEWKKCWWPLSMTDIFVLALGVELTISYAVSDFKETALFGEIGWRIGYFQLMSIVVGYFIISRSGKVVLHAATLMYPAMLLVILLGILNGFGIYPFAFEYTNSSKISTIGNTNWYCGYLLMYVFTALGILWCRKKDPRFQNLQKGKPQVYKGHKGHKSQEETFLQRLFPPNALWWLLLVYLVAGVLSLLNQGSFSGLVALYFLVAFVLYLSGDREDGIYKNATCRLLISRTLPAAMVLAVVGAVFLLVVNTQNRGSFFAAYPQLNRLFLFNNDWGSGRRKTWLSAYWLWKEQDPLHKCFGVGPDCFYACQLYVPEWIRDYINKEFEGLRLTNGHCEYLTHVVNIGVCGAVLYLGMIVSAIVRFVQAGRRRYNGIALGCALCLIAYTVNNLFSFQTTMIHVGVMMLLGFGEWSIRHE